MKAGIVWVLVAAALLGGCASNVMEVDSVAPFSPRGVGTETRDGYIILSWLRNQEPDVTGYRVYVSDAVDGVYAALGETNDLSFTDFGATNGITAYYAVTAFDAAGNESEMSTEVAYDTPRPEGSGVVLPNFRDDPARAGYDFSTYSIGPFDDQFTDVYFDFLDGIFYLVVWDDTEIQDMGYTESLSDIGGAPAAGWSPTKDVRLIPGHTCVIRTWDNHYAKVRVRSLSGTNVTFDWAYQLQPGNTRLKQAADRGPLRAGTGSPRSTE